RLPATYYPKDKRARHINRWSVWAGGLDYMCGVRDCPLYRLHCAVYQEVSLPDITYPRNKIRG
ncbi:hypothetical protein, partial [Hoylesella shahii]|uniref:hypothetical protein n=1 Tax=Hoylesella shahii TaxID=228603 RepID=UPI00248ED190